MERVASFWEGLETVSRGSPAAYTTSRSTASLGLTLDGTWSIMHRDRKNQYLRYLIGETVERFGDDQRSEQHSKMKESSSSTERLPVCDYIAGQNARVRRDGPNPLSLCKHAQL